MNLITGKKTKKTDLSTKMVTIKKPLSTFNNFIGNSQNLVHEKILPTKVNYETTRLPAPNERSSIIANIDYGTESKRKLMLYSMCSNIKV